MMKKIGLTLLCASSLLTTNAFSTNYSTFAQGRGIEYEIPVNNSLVITNILFWQVKAVCVITSENMCQPMNVSFKSDSNHLGNPLTVTMLRKSGSVNDKPLSTGESIDLNVQAGDVFYVTADSGAKVELFNLGQQPIKASCSTA